MPTFVALRPGFGVHHHGDGVELRFPEASPGLSFRTVEQRMKAQLTFGGNRMRVDVSLQPGVVVRTVDQAAREDGADPNAWRALVVRELRAWTVEHEGEPRAAERCFDDLAATVGALTHPLLGHLYTHGKAALWEVPRWASPLLQQAHPPAAAAWLLGESSNRRVARALATGLLASADGHVHLGGVALAVIAKDMLGADDMANVLDAAAAAPRGPLPDVDDVRTIRLGLALVPPSRRAALLCDVAAHHDTTALTEVMRHLWWVRDTVERPLPQRLDALRDACRRHVPVLEPAPPTAAPAPSAAAPPARRVSREARHAPTTAAASPAVERRAAIEPPPPPPRLDDPQAAAPTPRPTPRPTTRGRFAMPLTAPRARSTGPVPARWSVPAQLQHVHLLRHAGLRFVVPTSTAELRAWATALRNCLDGYGAVASSHQTWLIGIERAEQIIGCVEITPGTRHIRQALGARNAPLPPDVLEATLQVLRRTGLTRS